MGDDRSKYQANGVVFKAKSVKNEELQKVKQSVERLALLNYCRPHLDT